MKEITLEQPQEVLKVNIEGKSYSIPLAGSMPFMDAMTMRKGDKDARLDLLINFFRRYIPDEVFNTLSSDSVGKILEAWTETSKEVSGAAPGES